MKKNALLNPLLTVVGDIAGGIVGYFGSSMIPKINPLIKIGAGVGISAVPILINSDQPAVAFGKGLLLGTGAGTVIEGSKVFYDQMKAKKPQPQAVADQTQPAQPTQPTVQPNPPAVAGFLEGEELGELTHELNGDIEGDDLLDQINRAAATAHLATTSAKVGRAAAKKSWYSGIPGISGDGNEISYLSGTENNVFTPVGL